MSTTERIGLRYVLVMYINHPFSMSITKVTLVRGAVVDIEFGQRVLNLVREDTSRQTRN
jgi:hypothetical protein